MNEKKRKSNVDGTTEKNTRIIEGNHVNFTRIFSVSFIVMLFQIIIIKSRIYEKQIFDTRAQLRKKKRHRSGVKGKKLNKIQKWIKLMILFIKMSSSTPITSSILCGKKFSGLKSDSRRI